jgi:hypothetical protein
MYSYFYGLFSKLSSKRLVKDPRQKKNISANKLFPVHKSPEQR